MAPDVTSMQQIRLQRTSFDLAVWSVWSQWTLHFIKKVIVMLRMWTTKTRSMMWSLVLRNPMWPHWWRIWMNLLCLLRCLPMIPIHLLYETVVNWTLHSNGLKVIFSSGPVCRFPVRPSMNCIKDSVSSTSLCQSVKQLLERCAQQIDFVLH